MRKSQRVEQKGKFFFSIQRGQRDSQYDYKTYYVDKRKK